MYEELTWHEEEDENLNDVYVADSTVYVDGFEYRISQSICGNELCWTNTESSNGLVVEDSDESSFFDSAEEGMKWAERNNADHYNNSLKEDSPQNLKMIIFVDIDGTICEEVFREDRSKDYLKHVPIPERIEHINELHDQGHEITYYTGRGAKSGIDWYTDTYDQLTKWGCKFTDLICGHKKHYDLQIDDKSVNSEAYFQLLKLKKNTDLRS